MNRLFLCVVIPCLNEEQTLLATCQSLGFGPEHQPPRDTALILVDNGSTDRTRSVALVVQKTAPRGAVLLTEEREKGYVPPRRCGNAAAVGLAHSYGFSKSATLIVQADADTDYSDGYLESIRETALKQGTGLMFDARMEWPRDLLVQHCRYIELCDNVDSEFSSVLSDQPTDVLIDDKACAYFASDYEDWGEHQREFTTGGDEIFSETTRLYLRAKARGVSRFLCEDAVARHSVRRVTAEPALSFATAGFPREDAFRHAWRRVYNGPESLTDFVSNASSPQLQFAINARRAHLWGLFSLLPAHVSRALGQDYNSFNAEDAQAASLPQRSLQTVRHHPGVLLEDVFGQIDRRVFGL